MSFRSFAESKVKGDLRTTKAMEQGHLLPIHLDPNLRPLSRRRRGYGSLWEAASSLRVVYFWEENVAFI